MANNAPTSFGTAFATAGFSFDPNLSPNNQTFSSAVLAVVNRNPVAAGTGGTQGTSFVNIVVTGTATIATLQVTTATIATENVSTSTITQLVVGTGSFGLLSASGTSTFGAGTFAGPLTVSGTATINNLTVSGTATLNALQVTGTATIATLNVTGTATIGNLLATTETVGTLAFALLTGAGTATFGAGTFAGPLTASGTSTLNNITVSGTATLNALQVTGTATIATLNVTGTATIGNLLATTETLGALNVTGTATISTLNVTGTATIGNLLVTTETLGTATITTLSVKVIEVGTSTLYAWGTGTNYPLIQLAGIGALFGTATTGVVLTGGGLYYNGTSYVYGQGGTGVVMTLGTGTLTVGFGTGGTAGGTAAPVTVLAASGSGVVIGTATLYAWGGGTSNTPVLQFGGLGGLLPVTGAAVNGYFITAGAYYNGTSYIFTGTGTANTGTSTAGVLSLRGPTLAFSVGGAGTFGGTAAITNVFSVNGTLSPTIQAYGPQAATLVDMTPDQGTFTATLGAVTAAVNPVCFWARQGNHVILAVGTGTGTSNANTFTLAGLPAAITPARIQRVEVPDFAIENSGAVGSITTDAEMIVPTNGTMTFLNGGTATGWGATLFKGVSSVFTVSYLLN